MTFTDDPQKGATVFTDGDLKRLKEIVAKGIKMSDIEGIEFNRILLSKGIALLARLEAAENSALDVPSLCKTFDYCEEMGSYSQTSLDALERHEEWLIASGRKAAGK